jgi:hypothetical protein
VSRTPKMNRQLYKPPSTSRFALSHWHAIPMDTIRNNRGQAGSNLPRCDRFLRETVDRCRHKAPWKITFRRRWEWWEVRTWHESAAFIAGGEDRWARHRRSPLQSWNRWRCPAAPGDGHRGTERRGERCFRINSISLGKGGIRASIQGGGGILFHGNKLQPTSKQTLLTVLAVYPK